MYVPFQIWTFDLINSEEKIQNSRQIMSCTKNSYLGSKVMQKIQIFMLIMSCTKNSYLALKRDAKNSDFQANYELY